MILSSCKMILSLPILVFCCEQEWDVIFSISFFCGKHLINIFLSLVPIYKPEIQWEWSIFPKNTSQCPVQVSNLDTLNPRGCTPFGEHQESRPLARPDFLSMSFFVLLAKSTLVPEAIYRGSEERSKSPLVESVGNLTSMLSQVQKLNLDDDWFNEYVSQSSSRFNFCTWLSIEFPTDSTRGNSLCSSLLL